MRDGDGGRLRDLFFWRRLCPRGRFFSQQFFEFGIGEADDAEIKSLGIDGCQFFRQEFIVPSRTQREAIVRDHERTPLNLAQMIEHDHRHFGEAELLRRQQPPVPGHDAVAGIDQNRIHEPELGNRRRDLRHLFRRMRPRIPRIRHQAIQWPQFDPPRHGRRAINC